MKFYLQLAVLVLVGAGILSAADAPALTAKPAAPRFTIAYEAVLRNGFSIHYNHRDVLKGTTRLFFTSAPDSGFVDVPTAEIVSNQRIEIPVPAPTAAVASATTSAAPVSVPTTKDVGQIVSSAGNRHQIDPDFLNSVIRAESNFNPHAVSRKGAQGLMQLMPGTANELGVKNAFEPAENIDGGARYLRELLDLYNGDAAKALAAYNAGPHRVQQYGGVPPYRETHSYVAKIIRDYNRAKLAQHPELKAAAKSAPTGQTKSTSTRSTTAKARTVQPAKSKTMKAKAPAAQQQTTTAQAPSASDKSTTAEKAIQR